MKDTFIFNVKWRDVIRDFPPEVRLEIYEAIIDYATKGEEMELSDMAKGFFAMVKIDIDKVTSKYQETCDKRRAAGRKGGLAGGAPEGNQNATNQSKTKQNKAKQSKTKQNKHDNEYEYDNELSFDNKLSQDNKKEIVFTDNKEKTIYPYEKIFDLWNSILGGKLPKVRMLTAERKEKIRIRLTDIGKPEEWLPKCEELFRKIGSSRFMCGDNNTNWKANFDWLFGSPNNWVKVLEGNYDNMGSKGKGYDLVHFEGEHNPDVYRQMKEELKQLQE